MTRTDDVLSAIDHALDDWEVSDDAMRWTPEPASEPGEIRSMSFRFQLDAMESYLAAFRQAAQAAAQQVAAFFADPETRRMLEVLAALANPPPAMRVDRAEYHRRQRNRQRRAR